MPRTDRRKQPCKSLFFFLLVAIAVFPSQAIAGGTELSGDGTRGLGRGGAVMTRPDDPYVMVRNPALLADLWGSQLYFNTLIGIPHSCSQLSGGWGWGYRQNNSVISMGEGERPLYYNAEEGTEGGPSMGRSFNLSPSKVRYANAPYPEICYSAGASLIPAVLLTTKLDDSIGIGIGFVPPEVSQLHQMGNRDGTLDTPDGKRPNPLRYLEPSFQEVTYFGLLGAIGYRIQPWIRIGAGFRWTMVLVDVYSWSNSGSDRDPTEDIRSQFYGQDLFVPGFVASVHVVPMDSLDMAIGFRWEDRVRMEDAKIDIHSSPFSFYAAEQDWFLYKEEDDDEVNGIGAFNDVVTNNIPGVLNTPPPVVPQLSFGIRFADRIKPRPQRFTGLNFNSDPVRDPMADENWDIEFNAIYYFTSALDRHAFTTDGILYLDKELIRVGDIEDGNADVTSLPSQYPAGICVEEDDDDECIVAEQTPAEFKGKDQVSLRLGGDYNVMPNLLSLRAGVSYETRGQEPGYARPTWNMPFERLGLHTGITWRIDGRTDLSIGYAHFFQETIRLALNGEEFPESFWEEIDRDGDVHELQDDEVEEKFHVVSKDDADAKAQIPIYNINDQKQRDEYGDYKANAGTHKFGLDVFSISVLRHF